MPEARRLKPVEVVERSRDPCKMEMDFRLEAAAASEFGREHRRRSGLSRAAIDWDRTASEVLTLEWVDGTPLSDLARARAAGLDLPKLGRAADPVVLAHALRDGFFHADMHQGNLFVDARRPLVAVDFGIMGRLGAYRSGAFSPRSSTASSRATTCASREVHFEAGYVPQTPGRGFRPGDPRHRRADPFAYGRPDLDGETPDAAVRDHGAVRHATRHRTVMLQKTMVVVEGVARTLDPRLDMWSTAEPVVRDWIERKFGADRQLEDAGRRWPFRSRCFGIAGTSCPGRDDRGEACRNVRSGVRMAG